MRVTLSIPGGDSLKGKRRVVRRVLDRVRNQFNAAAAEVAQQDNRRQAVLGFAVVSNDGAHANSMLDKIAGFIPGLTEAIMVERSLELVHLGDDHWSTTVAGDGGDPWWRS